MARKIFPPDFRLQEFWASFRENKAPPPPAPNTSELQTNYKCIPMPCGTRAPGEAPRENNFSENDFSENSYSEADVFEDEDVTAFNISFEEVFTMSDRSLDESTTTVN